MTEGHSRITIRCAACGGHVGYCAEMDEVDAIAADHDEVCTATRQEKAQAAVDIRFAHIAMHLTEEGFPCQ